MQQTILYTSNLRKVALVLWGLFLSVSVFARQTTFKGTVLDEARKPVKGVKVAIGSSQFVESDAKGKFELTVSTNKSVNTVVAEKEGYEKVGFKYIAGSQIEIVMRRQPILNGKVIDAAGRALSGLEIKVEAGAFQESDWSDNDGLFRIRLQDSKPLGNKAVFFVNGMRVNPSDVQYADGFNVKLLNQVAPGKKEDVSEQSFKVTVFLLDGTLAKNTKVYIEDVEYVTDEQGEFVVNGTRGKPNDIKVQGFDINSSNYDDQRHHLVIRVEPTESPKEEPLVMNPDSMMMSEYKEDFNLVLRQLEIRKQNLSENSLRIKTEMERIAESLNADGPNLTEAQKEELSHDLLILETELIENEIAYEKAQEETKKIIDQMKYTLRAKDHKIEEIETELRVDIIIGGVIILGLGIVAFIYYIIAKRDRKQRTEIEKAYQNIQTISDIGKEITATLDFETLVQTVHASVDSLIDATIFGVGITNKALNKIEFKSYIEQGETQSYFYESLDDDYKFSVWCLKHRKEVLINDIRAEYARYIPSGKFKPTDEMPQSLIYLPLIIENEAIGVITVQSFKKNAYTTIDTTILQTLASYVSIALDNSNAYEVIKDKNKNITNSIRYAQTIQQAILPSPILMDQYFSDHFIIYRPKDIVSGDFYWMSHVEASEGVSEKLFVAAVDCTGHGVPGAFMSMIGNTLLDELVEQKGIHDPAEILEKLNDAVKEALKQESKVNDDGMDICLCLIEKRKDGRYDITFTGAKRPLYFYRKAEGQIITYRGDAKSIGGIHRKRHIYHKEHIIAETGDAIYLTSDGMADQSNMAKEKFGTKKFTDLLQEVAPLHMSEQERFIEKALENHQGKAEQRDDILIMGVRF